VLELFAMGLGAAMVLSALLLAAGANPVFAPGGGYQGVFLQKNGLGQRAALFLILAAALLSRPQMRAKVWLWVAVAAAVWMLVMSRSVTSQMTALMALGTGAVILAWRRGGTARGVAMILSATILAAVMAPRLILDIPVIDRFLEHFGKARDLTGRVILWSVALERGAEAPVLGQGYFAFWQAPGFAHDVALLRSLYGSTVAVFHNFLLEAYVGLGLVGVLSLGLLVGGCGRAVLRGSRGADQMWGAILFGVAVFLSLLGASLSRPHEVVLLLLVALAVATARTGTARA
jgi:exopolysaccharide production protein ExoQ